MKFTALHVTVLASSLALACGGDDDNGSVNPDGGGGGVDGSTVDAPAQRTCALASDLGTPAGLAFQGIVLNQNDPEAPEAVFVRLLAVLDQGPPIDGLDIQLWPGFGPFDPAITTGSFPITGAETSFYTCGACALLIGDADAEGVPEQNYVASAGTINVTTASSTVGETIEGSLTNATFREVTFDDDAQMQTDVPGGCTVTIAEAAFTATLVEEEPARLPKTSPRRRFR